jgi:hypothetical protein
MQLLDSRGDAQAFFGRDDIAGVGKEVLRACSPF